MNSTSLPGEPVQVEARLLSDGRILPSTVHWRGNTYTVTDVGRQWSDQDQGHTVRCLLVRLASGQTLELALYADAWTWRVRMVHESPRMG